MFGGIFMEKIENFRIDFKNIFARYLCLGLICVAFANSFNSLSVVASSWLSCRRFKAMSLVGIYP